MKRISSGLWGLGRRTYIADQHRALRALLQECWTLRSVVAHWTGVLAEVGPTAFPLHGVPGIAG